MLRSAFTHNEFISTQPGLTHTEKLCICLVRMYGLCSLGVMRIPHGTFAYELMGCTILFMPLFLSRVLCWHLPSGDDDVITVVVVMTMVLLMTGHDGDDGLMMMVIMVM